VSPRLGRVGVYARYGFPFASQRFSHVAIPPVLDLLARSLSPRNP